MPIGAAESELRIKFFDHLFADQEGYLCIASHDPTKPKNIFPQKFFKWPTDFKKIEEYIIFQSVNHDVWFCVNLLSKANRKKEFCLPSQVVWADLDEVDPASIQPSPQVVIESSPGRFQALWRMTMTLDAGLAENYSKRVAYSIGADKSGWDLTQLLRVPFTTNFKYKERPQIQLLSALEAKCPPLLFEALPKIEAYAGDDDIYLEDVPDNIPNSDLIIYKYSQHIKSSAFVTLFTSEPEEDWSKNLWRLIHLCLEAGMTAEETFSIVRASSCNKYDRDNRPITHLWRDVRKAELAQQRINVITANFRPLLMPLLTKEPASETFINEYKAWAVEATDAVPQFHDLAAFIMCSAVVSNSVRLETTYGLTVPNLWGMILGDSTLTRKTTAMRMVMDILQLIDPDMLLATDGTAEGLLTGLETRPNRTSFFFRDEISGFFDAINRKDYLAGMPETLTALYDVPGIYSRRLRKETIRLQSPVFIFFGGGVRDRVYEVLTEEYVLSGFIPRFLVVAGDTDLGSLRRTGPAHEAGTEKRTRIVSRVADLYEQYASEVTVKIDGQAVKMPPRIKANLTEEAWNKYGDYEELMLKVAHDSSIPMLAQPTFERLSRSLLKMSMILAAIRQAPQEGEIFVTEDDVINSAWYVQNWGRYSVELISSTGKGFTEKLLDKILRAIGDHPGILRSTLMQHYHLTKKHADDILGTLEDRQVVRREQHGRGASYWIT